jgi:hypothetical protein
MLRVVGFVLRFVVLDLVFTLLARPVVATLETAIIGII